MESEEIKLKVLRIQKWFVSSQPAIVMHIAICPFRISKLLQWIFAWVEAEFGNNTWNQITIFPGTLNNLSSYHFFNSVLSLFVSVDIDQIVLSYGSMHVQVLTTWGGSYNRSRNSIFFPPKFVDNFPYNKAWKNLNNSEYQWKTLFI